VETHLLGRGGWTRRHVVAGAGDATTGLQSVGRLADIYAASGNRLNTQVEQVSEGLVLTQKPTEESYQKASAG
jgi:hypothetical protein